MIRTIILRLLPLSLLGVGGPDEPAGATRACIDLSAVTSRAGEDERTIRFDLIGGRTYRNRLPGRCPGLHQSSRGFGALAFEVQGSRLCRGDRVRVIDSASPAAERSTIGCPLGDFVAAETVR